jgi:hypothetical protein
MTNVAWARSGVAARACVTWRNAAGDELAVARPEVDLHRALHQALAHMHGNGVWITLHQMKTATGATESPPGGFVTRINLSDSWRSENTINTHKYNTIYWSSSKSYYNFSSRINFTEEVWSQNYASKDKSDFAEAIPLNGQTILFALKENTIHRHSKSEDPGMEFNSHRFRHPIDNPHRHRQQEEAAPHLHTEDNKSKAWATTLSKTYLRWSKDHY